MASHDLHKQFDEGRKRDLRKSQGRTALVATTADSAGDKVMVTLPYTERPTLRIEVNWRPTVKVVAGELQVRYPQRGDEGAVFQVETGELWLIY